MTTQVGERHYTNGKYDSLDRYISYYYQLDAIRRFKPASILFVGVGDEVVPGVLKREQGSILTTLDIDARLAPDLVADVRSLPFPDASFDLVCAFQVLEHMPFTDSEVALAEMARVSRRAVIISLPHRQAGLAVALKFPFMRSLFKKDTLSFSLLVPLRFPGLAVSRQHHWEIDWWTVSLSRVRRALNKHFDIVREFTPPLNHYHRFFSLTPLRRP